ncbi:hypothetical protein AB1Y20_014480 [Prymnesium parvum]|uniref:Nuclear protein MDM1 n=1 Tax=Prymnesium parvum TaxID=97485 RepID=A0AB34IDU3_PRYPA
MDFSAGPPDLTGLDRVQKLEVMREYRRWKERPREVDFFAGPPDVSHLEGAERLKLLRQYRQWQQSHGLLPPSPDARIVGRPPAFEPPEPPPPAAADLETIELPPEPAAGMASGVLPTHYSYFERAVTERASHTTAPAAWVVDQTNPPTPPKPAAAPSPPTHPPSPRGGGGAAGMCSSQRQGDFGWLESDDPRHHRAVFPEARQLGLSERRIFAPDLLRDDAHALETQRKAREQKERRQKEWEDELSRNLAKLNQAPTAGVRSNVDPEHLASSMHPGSAFSPTGRARPVTVGMSKAAAEAALSQWRREIMGVTEQPPPSPLVHGPAEGPSAGVPTSSRGKASVRGHVGELDSRSAAEYNLQVKQKSYVPSAAASAGADPNVSASSSVKVAAPSEAAANSNDGVSSRATAGPTPSSSLAGLSHAERLARMREMRQQREAQLF